MITVLERAYLRYSYGTSDKVYNISIIEDDILLPAYKVIAEYGRYNSVLKTIEKYRSSSRSMAMDEYNALVKEKLLKGYRPTDATEPHVPKPKNKRLQQLAENQAEGLRRIDFDL